MRLHPFRALTPPADRAAEVASPPYDVVSRDEARALAQGKPASFLRVVRPDLELPDGVDVHADEAYGRAAKNLRAMVRDGSLVRDAEPALWVYRLTMDGIAQTGVVGAVDVDDYVDGRVKRHEFTRPDKEDDRTRHVDTVGAHTGPVFLACPSSDALTAWLEGVVSSRAPDLVVDQLGAASHEAWRVGDAAELARAAGAFDPMAAFYIADGHHRAASAGRARDLRRERSADGHAGEAERFLTVVFPADTLRVLAYNRVVADLNGLDQDAFLAAVAERFDVGEPGGQTTPPGVGHIAMALGDGHWRTLTPKPGVVPSGDPVGTLDVAVLQDALLSPVLGIEDPRTNPRIAFVGGIRGADVLMAQVKARGGVAFSMAPTPLDALVAVADAGEVMPPKSTWFEPKLASGLFVNAFDSELLGG